MSKSDITFDGGIFDPDQLPLPTKQFNTNLLSQSLASPKGSEWWEIGAAEFRLLQAEGKTSWPAPTIRLPQAKYIQIPSRDSNRSIKCRVMPPLGSKPDGVFLHLHGGGHVLGHCDWFDEYLSTLAAATNLTVISPEYRLAPEDPFPAGPNDVYDVATYLVDNSPAAYGGALKFVCGESAGATLSMLTVLFLLKERPDFAFQGAGFIYGVFDWSLTPSAGNCPTRLVLGTAGLENFADAFLGPGSSRSDRQNPEVSPLYHEIFRYPGSHITSMAELQAESEKKRVKLPPALFLCGTLDPLIDDTVLMSFRYQVAGGEAVVKFVPGGPHGFNVFFPKETFEPARIGQSALLDFLKERL